MQLEKLQLNLRPRSNQQALDLGFSLLRMDTYNVYMAWLIPILSLGALSCLLSLLMPELTAWFFLLLWIPIPLLERAPLYVLSRLVFGERVSWREALRAWPKQLSGGLRMCSIGRFNTARGLYHAIYQLEGVTGKSAAERRGILAQSGTSHAAFWYGVICAHFNTVLQFGGIGLISLFISTDEIANPFTLLLDLDDEKYEHARILLGYASYLLGLSIIGPIFVACSFTLYLNRRATLEAWDLEIALRQMTPPTSSLQKKASRTLPLILTCVFASLFFLDPTSSHADDGKGNLDKCQAPRSFENLPANRSTPALDAEQTALRAEVAQIMLSDGVRKYDCHYGWYLKRSSDRNRSQSSSGTPPMVDAMLGTVVKMLAILALACAIVWLLYHYRQNLANWFETSDKPKRATEIGGLDIRPESLPDNITDEVLRLWQQGQQRMALALLYRATLSRLVEENGLRLLRGFTEGDCLRAAEQAHAKEQLALSRLRLTRACTGIWRDGAYGQRWPQTEAVLTYCSEWRSEFDHKVSV